MNDFGSPISGITPLPCLSKSSTVRLVRLRSVALFAFGFLVHHPAITDLSFDESALQCGTRLRSGLLSFSMIGNTNQPRLAQLNAVSNMVTTAGVLIAPPSRCRLAS